MTKVVKFLPPVPEKFGPQRAHRKKDKKKLDREGQLNLFTGGKVVKLSQLTPFEEALMLDERGDKNNARVLYLKAVDDNDSLADCLCNLGIIEFHDRQYPKAIDYFTRSLKEDPRHYEAHYNLANLYAEVGDFKLAVFHYQIAIEIEPAFPNSYFNLGLTYALDKDYSRAIGSLTQYKDLVPAEEQHQADELITALSNTH